MEENSTMEQMERETEEMTALCYITKDNAVFSRTEGGFVRLEMDGKIWDRVQVIRLFPFTEPDKFISIRTVEERSKEIGVIADMKQVNKETRKMLEEQLNLHYFTPVIKKIVDIKDEYGYAYFHVLTDRGECRFTINMGSNAVVRLSESRLLITDLDENRFEIADVFQLSQKEQRKLDLFL
ncbi:MAG: DUF1854 domain-containing protein [Lachnospiraceae bacterium]|nr:DUF1854 domain-containing protein [Lachnospiraceae bacterium]